MVACSFGAASALAQANPRISTKPAGQAIGHGNVSQPTARNELADLSGPSGGKSMVSPTDNEQLYLDAADQGQPWAQVRLAEIYLSAPDGSQRIEAAVNLLNLAALQDNAEALYQLGALAMAGRGMPPSADKAFEYCKRSAELGYEKAQYELAALYALGRGTEIDEDEAIKWGRKAIAQGNSKAKYSIGRLLLIRQDPEHKDEAVNLLQKASAAGIAEAAVLLAEGYTQGLYGLPQNNELARSLLIPHADAGSKEAAEALSNLPATSQ